ncbi:MAG TPA: HIT domain-containing protein [Cellulomonas sp.]
MADDCLFCAMVAGTVPHTTVWEGEAALAFADINPQAPVHVLVVPKVHLPDVVALGADPEAGAALLDGIAAVARQERLTDFRTVFNTGAGVGQSVFHVHAHLLAGRSMGWPPG